MNKDMKKVFLRKFGCQMDAVLRYDCFIFERYLP
jgi:hypothetical protein